MTADDLPKEVFASDRAFSFFSYTMSHGLLLLRSGKTNEQHTRIDILFSDVRAMEVRSWFTGIVIREVAPDHVANQPSKPGKIIEIGNRVYSLESSGWEGFVVAGIVNTCEDEGGLLARSPLLGPEIP